MTVNKTQKILTGLVVIQIILAALVFYLGRPKTTSNEPLIKSVSIDDISSVQISDKENNQVTIEKVDGNWVLVNSGNFPVISENVTKLVDDLANIHTGRLVTNTSASHQRLEVDAENYQRKVDLKTANGDFTLFIGSSPAQSNVHVRLSGQDAVYLTNAISTTTASALVSNWIDTSYIKIESNNVKEIQITTANENLQFQLNEAGEWNCLQLSANEKLDISNWTTYLTAFTNLRMVSPVSTTMDESYGFSSPLAKLTIKYTENEQEKTGELLIGKKDETDSNYYAKWSLSPYVVKLASFNAERITNITKTELISVPATETVAP
ncbi:MAG: hypothetical protein CVU46_17805 [Chloroflexi bacterium HGW-Chloroflexi-8]|jgi:hypothetical protein|nr:MAG: hypothetical protein CVU46_17805 [Chloroflexi bacterium HGW-Chloroflexi-8]